MFENPNSKAQFDQAALEHMLQDEIYEAASPLQPADKERTTSDDIEKAQAALLELEMLLTQLPLSNPEIKILADAAVAAARNLGRDPGSRPALQELKDFKGKLAAVAKEARDEVASRQENAASQAVRIEREYLKVSSIKGFEFIDKRAFETISKLFDDMPLSSRALTALEVTNNPEGELAKSVQIAALAPPEALAEIKAGHSTIRAKLRELSEKISCDGENKQFIETLLRDSKFVRVLAVNQTEGMRLLDLAIASPNDPKVIDDLINHFKPDYEAGRADVLQQAQSLVANINRLENHLSPDTKQLERIAEKYGVDLNNLNEESAMVLVGQARRDSRKILEEEAKKRGITLNELVDKAFANKLEVPLTVEQQDAVLVRIVARAAQDQRMMNYVAQVLQRDPRGHEAVIQEARDNPERLVKHMASIAGLSEEQARLYADILIEAGPDKREELTKLILANKSQEATRLFDTIARTSTQSAQYMNDCLDNDEPEKPKMCTIPPEVRDKVNAAGVLNLGQQPTNMSPVEVPSVIQGLPRIQGNPSIVLP